jgi:shikimate kinase
MDKPKVAIIIYGNIASGKSTVALLLSKFLPQFKCICPDDIRLETSLNGSIMSENDVYSAVVKEISQHTELILESTGAGTFFKHYLRLLSATDFKVIRVYLKCSGTVCFKRYQNRINTSATLVPMAHPANIRTSIETIESKISGLNYDLQFNTDSVDTLEVVNKIMSFYGTKC